jgi:hypothetical protein
VAGRGPAPKPAGRRARANKDPLGVTVLPACEPSEAPDLPDFHIEKDGQLVDFSWSPLTKQWWKTWCESPQASLFTSTDWQELLTTAIIANRFYRGDMTVAGELRLRVAKFGATPEDRARLRIVFADADEKEAKRAPGTSARERYGKLRAVGED